MYQKGVKKGVNKRVNKGYNDVMYKEVIAKIKALRAIISTLPDGYISKKNIGGNIYYYHQRSKDGKKISKYLNEDEFESLNALLEKRKKLEQEVKSLKKGFDSSYILMHKNKEVIELFFDENGYIKGIGDVFSLNHLPLGSVDNKGNINTKNLESWWSDRSIPLSRSGIKDVIEKLNINSPQTLLLKCFGLSLSDQYWIKPKDKDIAWADINFFDNDFSEDVGELLFGNNLQNKDLNLSSPDNTSVGNLKKRWKILDDRRILIKGGSNPYRQEAYNEIIAYKIAETLGLNSVKYSLVEIGGYPYSECEDFVNKDEDFIPAEQLRKILEKNNNDSSYTHLLKCATKLNIPGFKDFLNKLLVFDFIIANEDRHFNNFGAIRNVNNLNFIGPSPIFDSGASFGFNKISEDIVKFEEIEAKPFFSDITKQLGLVSDFSWIDIEKLNKIKTNIFEWFSKYKSKYLTEDRIEAISQAVISRIDYLIEKYL